MSKPKTDPVGEQRVSDGMLATTKLHCEKLIERGRKHYQHWASDYVLMLVNEIIALRSQSAAAAEERTYNDGLEDAIKACHSVGTIIQYVPQRSRTGIAQRKSNITDFVEAIRKVQRLAAPVEPKRPCGECHLQNNETCDICGAAAVEEEKQ